MAPKTRHATTLRLLLALPLLTGACIGPPSQPTPTPAPQVHGEAPPGDAAEALSGSWCRRHVGNPRCRPTPTPAVNVIPTASPTEQPTLTPVPPAQTATALPVPVATVVPPTVVVTVVVTVVALTDAQRWGIPDYPEVRPDNATANHTRGRPIPDAELPPTWDPLRPYMQKVDGNFTGTTEQILEWAALKWFPEQDRDLFKAQAVKETGWNQGAIGDSGVSFGILQIKSTVWNHGDQVKASTAFAADMAGAIIRAHYDGVLYTGDYASWNLYPIRPEVPNPTRLRRAVNAWYFGDGASHNYGDWTYNADGANSEYVGIILGGKVDEPGAQLNGQTLAGYLSEKPWRGW